MRKMLLVAATGLCLASCGSPYNTGDRAFSGGLIGGAGGAAVGGLAGGGKRCLDRRWPRCCRRRRSWCSHNT